MVDVIPNNEHGTLDLEALEAMLDDNVSLVALTHVSMSNGAVQPAAEVGGLAKSAGALFLLDACQSAGQLALDVEELRCDFLVYTGRKFMRGPRGTGVLYARSNVLDHLGPVSFVDGRSATWTGPGSFEYQPGAQRFEFGERSFSGKLGLAVATEYMLQLGVEPIARRVQGLAADLRSALEQLPGAAVLDEGAERCGIVTFNLDGLDAPVVAAKLRERSINVSAPGASNAQLDMGARNIKSLVRSGLHYYNTSDEIDRFVEALEEIQKTT